MKVITLHPADFEAHCRRLQTLVEAEYAPDLVVGIASGGLKVSALMFPGVPHVEVSCRRPSTESKSRREGLFAMVRRLPLWVRDTLRRYEARRLATADADGGRTAGVMPGASGSVSGASHILVVDDAVDSGATLSAVLNALHDINPAAHLRAAAITVTTPAPLAYPDFCIYKNVLIRFPWSMDYTPPRR